ncbi:MAG: diguanylate cyclase [Clostridia bacterium]
MLKHPKLHIGLWLAAAAIVAFFVILISSFLFNAESKPINNEPVVSFNSGWTYQRGGVAHSVESLPISVALAANEPIVIKNTLPSTFMSGITLATQTQYQSLEVFIDGRLIYEEGTHDKLAFGKTLGTLWNFVRIPQGTEGKSIELRYVCPYDTAPSQISSIVLGSKNACVFDLAQNSATSIIFCVLTLFLAFILILVSILMAHRRLDSTITLFLGIFSLFAAIWTMTDSGIVQFFSGNRIVAYLTSFASFLLMPIPMLLFLRVILKTRKKRVLNLLSLLFIINFAVVLILQLTNVLDFPQTIISSHILIALSCVTVGYLFAVDIIKFHRLEIKLFALATFMLCLLSMLDVVRFYTPANSDNSFFFRIGLIIFIIMFSIVAFYKALEIIRASIETHTYRRLAYTDAMTHLGNRTAFDRCITRLSGRLYKLHSLAFIAFDLNRLKIVNDSMGHSAGDELIRGAASCIAAGFSPYGECYRVGGDEFTVVLENASLADINMALHNMDSAISEYNTTCSATLELARGFSFASSDIDINELISLADKHMYENKNAAISM